MSEENKNNNTSSIEQVATVVATTNDDVSSSLTSALFGDGTSSSTVNGGSLNSAGSASLADLASAGSLGSGADSIASAYSSGVLSALDQTYYGGALGHATAAAQSLSLVDAASLRLTPPSQDKTTYTIAKSTALPATSAAQMSAAAAAGTANFYYAAGSATYAAQATIGANANGSTVLGGAIFQQQGDLAISAGAALGVGLRSQLWVGNGSTGNLGLTYGGTSNAITPGGRSLWMGSSSYLSATGYVGGVADKSQAGTTLGASDTGLRTNAVNTADDVVMDIGADFGTIGDYRSGYIAPTAVIGNNNKITAGGTIGVFLNASMTVGSNVTMEVAKTVGSGFFIGSGAYYSAGINGSYLVHGGMGAAYSNTTLNTAARLYFGADTSVTLDQANWGNFAAQAGAIVSAGDGFYLRALEMSVGYGQDPNTGKIIGSQAATMTIGNNANIILAQSGLTDNGYNFYLGSNGAITVDGNAGVLSIGTGANIDAKTISIGNYAKDYSGTNPQTGSAMVYSWYNTGANNQVLIGSGATINLSGGIALDGNNGTLTLAGGGDTGNVLNAGFLSAGRFYREYNTPLVNSSSTAAGSKYNFVFDNTSGAVVNIGDGYTITLTAGVVDTGLTNQPTISNNGNLEVDTVNGVFTLGNSVHLTANSMVVGDYYLSTVNQYNNSTYIFSYATSGASLTYGTNANINLSGAVLLNGESDRMVFGDGLILNASTMSFGPGTGGGTQQNAAFSTGVNASVTISNGFVDNLYNGIVQFGDNTIVHLLAGDLSVGAQGVGTGRSWFHMGTSNTLTLDGGSIVMTNTAQTFDWGDGGVLNANSLSLAGNDVVFSMGASANVTLSGGIAVSATSAALTFGASAIMNLGDVTFDAAATAATFNVGNNATFKANNFVINADNPTITFGTSIAYDVVGWNLNGANNNVTLGDGATGSLGNINAVAGVFDTGNATSVSFGTATLSGSSILNLNGGVTGSTLDLSGNATVNIASGMNLNLDSVAMDGTGQVTINVAANSNLHITSLTTTSVGTTNVPKIVLGDNAVVTIDGVVTNASNSQVVNVDYSSSANGIVEYKGNIQEASGNITLTNFSSTSKHIFEVDSAYSDQTRYVTSVIDGVLYVQYVDAATGELKTLAEFNYSTTETGYVPNVIITPTSDSATNYTITITKCFLTGTHILTPEGEVTVENLKAGDQVITMQNGQQVSQRVVWAGCMNVNVNNYEHKDALYPVRIKAHAFGLNQPCRDLLVTPEHTIYVDGGLIPARMLVNGRSIITDTSMDRFTVYHIETEEHSILLSENLTTESYLDTDDRHLFNGDAVNLHLTFNENAGHQSWETDAAAPLTVARHQVEPIWQRLDRHATKQGYAPVSKVETTNNPELCLITQKGERLQPIDVKANTYSFYVPANVCVVAMHSKAALPSEVVGPFLDDRRMLGVLVAKISILGGKTFEVLPSDMTGLSGWHPAELNRTDRWTKGLATLPEAVSETSNQVKLIKIELTATSEYFVDTIESTEKIA